MLPPCHACARGTSWPRVQDRLAGVSTVASVALQRDTRATGGSTAGRSTFKFQVAEFRRVPSLNPYQNLGQMKMLR
jgi:hypothetical protein